jgi:hypothetical protein
MDEDLAPWAGLPRAARASGGDTPGGDTPGAGVPGAGVPGGAPGTAAPRRGRGGQHAARHGKPPRRRRGASADGSEDRSEDRTPAGPPPDRAGQGWAGQGRAAQDADQASRTVSFELPDFPGQDEDGGTRPLAWREDAGGYDPRAPWERGDSS